MRLRLFSASVLSLLCTIVSAFSQSGNALITPPKPQRELRAAWITTVWNVDWPSKPGLSTAQQQAELLAILNRVQALNMNAVVLQVRSTCDAMYASPYEPWSQYLTGQMGKAPSPMWDPLAFAVAEAHKRGIELHAWFNPFRARVTDKVVLSSNHIAKKSPSMVREHGKFLWLDPGDVMARDYSLKVILDVVRRYDIDAVQIDDYFYPSEGKAAKDFDDDITWKRYQKAGGKLNRDDWRRENINIFIQRLNAGIKGTKSWVKFGISPPGIWRPGNPTQIKGRDVYTAIYADSRKWFASGWCDYFAPQLYWKIDPPQQSYPVLLKWWTEQNSRGRHLWPGLGTGNVGGSWKPEEIVNQIKITRNQPGATGHIHYHMKTIMQNKALSDQLAKLYAEPALVPASGWLGSMAPSAPTVTASRQSGGIRISWKPSGREKSVRWVVQKRSGGNWSTEILPDGSSTYLLKAGESAQAISVTGVSRTGILGTSSTTRLN